MILFEPYFIGSDLIVTLGITFDNVISCALYQIGTCFQNAYEPCRNVGTHLHSIFEFHRRSTIGNYFLI